MKMKFYGCTDTGGVARLHMNYQWRLSVQDGTLFRGNEAILFQALQLDIIKRKYIFHKSTNSTQSHSKPGINAQMKM